MRHWYSRFGIEEPFPWLPFVAVGLVLSILAAAAVIGIVSF
ncbi:hypothetical protein [Mycolicibacterium goodii]|nr:hypothetical protein [Mycolicibacterium goodii]